MQIVNTATEKLLNQAWAIVRQWTAAALRCVDGRVDAESLSPGKGAPVRIGRKGRRTAFEFILALCRSSLQCLHSYPRMRSAVTEFLACDLEPVLRRHMKGCVEIAV